MGQLFPDGHYTEQHFPTQHFPFLEGEEPAVAKTLLDGVNCVLTKVGVLDSDTGLLTSLSNPGKQTFIDLAIQTLNETVDELYSLLDEPKPNHMAESQIILRENVRNYALASDLVALLTDFALIDESDGHMIFILKEDGYRQLILGDLNQDDKGLPSVAAMRPIDGQLFMDRAPLAEHDEKIYKYRYVKELELVKATDFFPFGNTVFRAVCPVASELWKRERHKDFSQGIVNASLGRAARLVRKIPPERTWIPGGNRGGNISDPFKS